MIAPSKKFTASTPYWPSDWQLWITLLGAIAVVLVLRQLLPTGYASHITSSTIMLASTLLLYPLVEELLFRGVIQGELLRHDFWSRQHFFISRANLMTSFLFALLHLVHQAPIWALAVTVPSLVMGHFRERYRSIVAALALHVYFNGVFIIAGAG